jgi:hypothetical protein
VKICLGDIFSEPASVFVLPCATDGTLKDFAASTRRQRRLPEPPTRIALGHLHVSTLKRRGSSGRYLVYAGVRDENGSSSKILLAIGRALGSLTASDRQIRSIATPLLGTGAGRVSLRPAVSALVNGFRETAANGVTLSLCAPRLDTHTRLATWYQRSIPKWRDPPRVFISYSQGKKQSPWVGELQRWLRRNRIEARLDRSHLRLTATLSSWMDEQFAWAQKVIVVSDETYARKADTRTGGVGYEIGIIERELASRPDTRKYLLVVRSDNQVTGTPHCFKDRLFLHCPANVDTGQVFNRILGELYEVDTPTPLGQAPLIV